MTWRRSFASTVMSFGGRTLRCWAAAAIGSPTRARRARAAARQRRSVRMRSLRRSGGRRAARGEPIEKEASDGLGAGVDLVTTAQLARAQAVAKQGVRGEHESVRGRRGAARSEDATRPAFLEHAREHLGLGAEVALAAL